MEDDLDYPDEPEACPICGGDFTLRDGSVNSVDALVLICDDCGHAEVDLAVAPNPEVSI